MPRLRFISAALIVLSLALPERSVLPVLSAQGAQGKTTLEVRLAETAPASGLTEAAVAGSRQKVYLHAEAIATGADVVRARVVSGAGGYSFSVAVTFGRAGADRLALATAGHAAKPLAILVDGELVAAPILKGPVSDGVVITGNFQNDRAEAIASGLNAR